MTDRTIFALATAPAKSGVAVIRISGKRALPALEAVTNLKNPKPNQVYYSAVRRPQSGEIIDKGLILYFQAPHSFTGEDVVELQLHGSIAVIKEALEVLSGIDGLRHAQAGEFTKRAFLGSKMDLLEAEGLADLIDSETITQKTQAMRQMQGEMSVFYNEIRGRTIHCLALLEAYIDFPDEEIPDEVLEEWKQSIIDLQAKIRSACADKGRGERLRDGLSIVIIGSPNAGKSSLLNALAKRDVAIVSHHAGTTRDIIEVHLDIAGYPVVLMDTAGLREAGDEIEAEGINRAKQRAEEADIKIALFDGSKLPAMDDQTNRLIDKNTIVVVSKSDLLITLNTLQSELYISTKTNDGIEQLLLALEQKVVDFFSGGETPFITRSRHRELLLEADFLLGQALQEKPLELSCEELRRASLAIGKITGKIALDDILDVIFRQFCIGK